MKTLLGFLSVIAARTLQLTYLHRTQPTASAIRILIRHNFKFLKVKSPKLPKLFNCFLGSGGCGYLEHRSKLLLQLLSLVVAWWHTLQRRRSWLKLHDLLWGWHLAKRLNGKKSKHHSKSIDHRLTHQSSKFRSQSPIAPRSAKSSFQPMF